MHLGFELAETDVSRAFHAYCDAPSVAGRAAVRAALTRREAIAASLGVTLDERERLERAMDRAAAR